jgi:ParB family chromosome partitioning protein
MRGRDALRELLGSATAKESVPSPAPHKISGAVKAMNLGLQRLSDEAAAAKALRESLASAEQVVDIEPTLVDSSFISDRLSLEVDPDFSRLKESMAAHGQQVPILVRRHPLEPARFQAAYGHRRLRAARELGIRVKAVVKTLSDSELVVAQGQENSERTDLSFIERALFAANLDKRGFTRETICAALSVDSPEASRLLSVASAVDGKIVTAIGPAPKAGRPRWLALAQSLAVAETHSAIKRIVGSPEFARSDTNERFNLVLAVAQNSQSNQRPPKAEIVCSDGRRIGWLERTKRGARLVSEDVAFAEFLHGKLESLRREFEAQVEE